MFHKFLLTTAAAVAMSGAAFAADLPTSKGPPVYAPPPPPIFTWTGAYIGAQLGANFARSAVGIPLYPAYFGINDTSVSVGGKIGYNYQFGQFVAGIEGAGAAVFNSGSHLSGGPPGELYHTRQDFAGDIVGKAGMAFDRFLPYVKGGVAFAGLTDMHFIPLAGGSVSTARAGWTVGAGIDYAITDNWILGVDYAYSDFGTGHYFYLGPVNVHQSTNAVNASLSYKFDMFGPPAPVAAKY